MRRTCCKRRTRCCRAATSSRAGEALDRAAKANALDAATNEDARVELRVLKTQQAVLGLNTRRQKLYLDNRADVQRNEQLEQAANLNPFLQGRRITIRNSSTRCCWGIRRRRTAR